MSESEQDRQLENLLHAINHDIRTPLGNIRSATSILLQDISDPLTVDQRVFIEIIERSTIRLLDQSNRLMLFSQIAFTQPNLEPTQLSELLANVKKELKNSYGVESINILTDDDSLISCHAHTLSATLALLAAGDTKNQQDQPTDKIPTIQTQTKSKKLLFTIDSLMLAQEFAPSLIELASKIVQGHGSELKISESGSQRQFAFDISLA